MTNDRFGYAGRVSVWVALAALAVAVPWAAGPAHLGLAIEIAYTLTLAILWNVLAGYAGIVSIGQQAFVGFGAYVFFALVRFDGLPALAALPLAGLATGLIALPSALILFRLRGAYLAIGSWVLAEIFRLSFAQISALGGGSGQSLPIAAVLELSHVRANRELVFYMIAMFLVLVCTFGAWIFLRSARGRGLTAIRDNQNAAASLGVNVLNLKIQAYIAVAIATGTAGAFIFLQNLRISPDAAFSVSDWTGDIIFIVVIGGIGTLEGPFIGTAIFFLLRGLIADYGSWYLIALGLMAVVIMLLAPEGIWGAIKRRYRLTLFPMANALAPGPAPGAGAPSVPTARP